jgi:hypothetical protein
MPGVFAVGDVRAGSVKRVGAAIGEGAAVVPQMHAYLAHTMASQQTSDGKTRVASSRSGRLPIAPLEQSGEDEQNRGDRHGVADQPPAGGFRRAAE